MSGFLSAPNSTKAKTATAPRLPRFGNGNEPRRDRACAFCRSLARSVECCSPKWRRQTLVSHDYELRDDDRSNPICRYASAPLLSELAVSNPLVVFAGRLQVF